MHLIKTMKRKGRHRKKKKKKSANCEKQGKKMLLLALNILKYMRGEVELHSASHLNGLFDVHNFEKTNYATKFGVAGEIQPP